MSSAAVVGSQCASQRLTDAAELHFETDVEELDARAGKAEASGNLLPIPIPLVAGSEATGDAVERKQDDPGARVARVRQNQLRMLRTLDQGRRRWDFVIEIPEVVLTGK